LERQESGKEPIEDSFSIEHILPQNPNEVWVQKFQQDEIDDATYRLGNMTPLEQKLNAKIGTESYKDKKAQAYSRSAFEITKNIQADDWTMSSIVNRQEKMAESALRIWRISY
ncbi:MAG: HNH endonuclease family protein, partial [Cyanobacteria bacterium J06598_1]